jgi:hypothetical protein
MERSEFNIHGRNMTPDAEEETAKRYEEDFERGLKPVEGEIEKSGDILQFIDKVEGYLNEELKDLGLGDIQLDARRMHIVPAEYFKESYKDAEINGVYRDYWDGIYVSQGKNRLQAYKSLLHEIIHQISHRSIYANPKTKENYISRVGYSNIKISEEAYEHFRGMNEAVVDETVKEILQKHADELVKDLGITEEEQKQPVNYYHDYMEILEIIMDKVAEKNDESRESVWSRFKKGQFSGEMMHLRDIERTFGKGALRVLAALGSVTSNIGNVTTGKVLEYFGTGDEAAKQKIVGELQSM